MYTYGRANPLEPSKITLYYVPSGNVMEYYKTIFHEIAHLIDSPNIFNCIIYLILMNGKKQLN